MIKVQGRLPRSVNLACSGGVDSMAVLDFLRRRHDITVLYYNHGTPHGQEAEQFLRSYCETNGLPFITEKLTEERPVGESFENWWRIKRYEFLDKYSSVKKPTITCHHLDDCVETWIWSSMNGTGKIIPYARNNIVRPFRMTRKAEFKRWALRNDVPWIEDPSNAETAATRNYIRNVMMPHVLQVNPGIFKTIQKKVFDT